MLNQPVLVQDSLSILLEIRLKLTQFSPMFHFYTPKNIRKPKVFLYFQGIQKWNIGLNWVNFERFLTFSGSIEMKHFPGMG